MSEANTLESGPTKANKQKLEIKVKQAGAELCQAQYELELLKFCLATKLDQHKLCN